MNNISLIAIATFLFIGSVFCWDSPRISESKCLVYRELIAKTIPYTSLSLFATKQERKRYVCNSFQGMIIGGVEAKPGEFPHMAAIGERKPNGNVNFFCGGSLISEWFVLSAAHCMMESPNIVRLGDHDFSTTSDNVKHADYTILDVIIHEDYDLFNKKNDIALIELNLKVKFNEYIRPACLHQSKRKIGEKVIATGWGKLGTFKSTSDKLMKVSLNVISNPTCYTKIGKVIAANEIYDSQICAGGKGNDSCQGDSGGPIQISHDDYPCIYDIVGVTSYGLWKCGKAPAIYTRVASYLDWIEKKVWQ